MKAPPPGVKASPKPKSQPPPRTVNPRQPPPAGGIQPPAFKISRYSGVATVSLTNGLAPGTVYTLQAMATNCPTCPPLKLTITNRTTGVLAGLQPGVVYAISASSSSARGSSTATATVLKASVLPAAGPAPLIPVLDGIRNAGGGVLAIPAATRSVASNIVRTATARPISCATCPLVSLSGPFRLPLALSGLVPGVAYAVSLSSTNLDTGATSDTTDPMTVTTLASATARWVSRSL